MAPINAGSKTANFDYDPFGNIRSNSGSGSNYLFQGEQQDPESSLYFLRARYYEPSTGRFITRDPIIGAPSEPRTQNPYVFVGNNPINYTDPSGKFWWLLALLTPEVIVLTNNPAFSQYVSLVAMNVENDIKNCDYGSAIWDLSDVVPLPIGGFSKKLVRNVSGGVLNADEVLRMAQKWLGEGYQEIAKGVFRSSDGTKQFRMTTGDLIDPKQGPHVHFESVDPVTGKVIENSHVKITP